MALSKSDEITLIELKKKLEKKQREYQEASSKNMAWKLFLNSGYGALTNAYFRFFDIRLATSVTSMGQVCIRGAAEYAERKVPGLLNIYSDTDSNFYSITGLVKKRFGTDRVDKEKFLKFCKQVNEKLIGPAIKEYFQKLTEVCNGREDCPFQFEMENEIIGDKAIWLKKKNYVVNVLHKDGTDYLDTHKLKVIGIEIVRTSTPQWVRDKLQKAVEIIFDRESYEEMMEFLKNCREEFKTLSFVEVAFPRGVNNMEKYREAEKSVPIHVRASHVYNRAVESRNLTNKYRLIPEGEKIKFAYIKEPNIFQSNVIACPDNRMPEELSEHFELDYDKQFQKTLEAPLEKFFKVMKWQFNEKSVSLAAFFE